MISEPLLIAANVFAATGAQTQLLSAALGTLSLVGLSKVFRLHWHRRRDKLIRASIRHDNQCAFVTNGKGIILDRNGVASVDPLVNAVDRLETALDRHFADPGSEIANALRSCAKHGDSSLKMPDDAGAFPFMISSLAPDRYLWRRRDVREYEKTERQNTEKLDHMIEALPVALLRLSRHGEIRSANKAARKLAPRTTLKGQNLADIVDGLGRPVNEWLADTIRLKPRKHTEVVILRNGPRDVYWQIGLVNFDGSLWAVVQDTTELKTLEGKFVQSQKMQAIGQLAGGVAHDFNNLLTAISGHCDLLMHARDPSDPEYSDLQQIRQNTNRAASLVKQLLAFSRKQNLKLELLDPRDILADVTHLLNRLVGEKIEILYNHDPDLGWVRADKRQLEQVIMNLVVNARDAMPEGGKIWVETEHTALTTPLQRDRVTVPVGDYVTIRVRDTGVGIPDETIGQVFEPFFSTKPQHKGTGLGLSTAYGIVKQTGGYIFVDSEVGKGTFFSIILPRYQKNNLFEMPHVETQSATATASIPQKILLVEDEPCVRAFAARAMRLHGHTIIEANNGEAALKAMETSETKFDIVVTDIIMPGLNGPEWVKLALEKHPPFKVIFISGYSKTTYNETNTITASVAYLQKPFSLTALINKINSMAK